MLEKPREVRPLPRVGEGVETGVRELIVDQYSPKKGYRVDESLLPPGTDPVDDLAILVNTMSVYALRSVCRKVCELRTYQTDRWPSAIELTELLADWAHEHINPPSAEVQEQTVSTLSQELTANEQAN